MSNILEFVIKLKDQLSSGLSAVGANVQRTFNNIDARGRQVSNSIASINNRLNDLQRTRDLSINLRDIRQANREITALERQRDRLQNAGNRSSGGSGLGGAALMAGGAFALRESVMQATKQQGLEDAIRFSMGKDAGNGMLDHISATSNKLGLDKMSSMEGAKTFLGATRGTLSAKQQKEMFDAIGEAASAMKLSGEDAKGTFLALGQIASKGTVSAEELRGQIGERIPGAFGIAAKAMGVTEMVLGDMMKKGDLMSRDFLPKFAAELHKTFGVEAINSSDSAQANFNRLTNSLNDLKNKVGTEVLPALMPLIKGMMDLFSWVSANIKPILTFVGIITGMVVLYKAWVKVQWLINAAMTANPIGVVIMLIGLLVAAIAALVAKFGSFKAAMQAVWDTVKNLGLMMWTAWKDIGDAIFTGVNVGVLKAIDWIARLATSVKNFVKDPLEGFTFSEKSSVWGDAAIGMEQDRVKRKAANNNIADAAWAATKQIWATDKGKSKLANAFDFSGGLPTTPGGAGSSGSDELKKVKTKVAQNADAITGGGTRNIYLQIGKFQDNVNIYAASAKEGIDDLGTMVEDKLLRLLNSASAMQ